MFHIKIIFFLIKAQFTLLWYWSRTLQLQKAGIPAWFEKNFFLKIWMGSHKPFVAPVQLLFWKKVHPFLPQAIKVSFMFEMAKIWSNTGYFMDPPGTAWLNPNACLTITSYQAVRRWYPTFFVDGFFSFFLMFIFSSFEFKSYLTKIF